MSEHAQLKWVGDCRLLAVQMATHEAIAIFAVSAWPLSTWPNWNKTSKWGIMHTCTFRFVTIQTVLFGQYFFDACTWHNCVLHLYPCMHTHLQLYMCRCIELFCIVHVHNILSTAVSHRSVGTHPPLN